MLIGILGPLTIEGDAGPVEVTGSKRRLLLTLLATTSPQPVSLERLASALWGDETSVSSPATLQTYVYQLRKLLGAAAVVTTPAGYALAGCDTDARRFEALARPHDHQTVEARRNRLAAALQLWRAEPFGEFPDVPDLAAERTRLVELRLAATADRIDDDLALGNHAIVVAELEALVAEHPLRERSWAQLMIALYRSDRQADSLRAYGRLRRLLRDEVGVSPGAALVTLERQILSHDPELRSLGRGASPDDPLHGRRRVAVLEIVGADEATPRRMTFETMTEAVDVALQEAQTDPGTLRAAIHIGEVDGHDGGAVSGPAVDRVARLRAIAQRGQILLTAAAQAELATFGEVHLVDLGEHRLRSSGRPERLYQLLAPGVRSGFAPLPEQSRDEREVFVGRTSEVEHVLGRVRRLRDGTAGGVVMLVGEAGIGKTATADQIARGALAGGTLVLWGRSVDGPWAKPYGAVMDAFAGYFRASAEDAPIARPEIVDEIRSLISPAGTAVASDPEVGDEAADAREAQLRTLVSIGRFVEELCATAPVLLVLDDLHWADGGTLAALRHLARETVGRPVLLLGTYRDDEVGPDHPLRAVLGALPRESDVERVRLRGLDADEVAAIALSITGADVTAEDADRIAADTAGNPFFVHQVLRQPDGGLPGSVLDVVGQRLRRLPASTQQLLRAVCVFDGDFSFTVATTVAGVDEDDALDALDAALDAHLLVAGDRPDTYGFVHAIAREAIAAEVNPSRRIRLHRRAAEALLATAGSGELTADLAGAVAGHFHRSRSLPGSEQGVPAALVAAEHATAVGALDDAVELCRAALELVPPGHERHPELLGQLGLALARAARADDATTTIGAAIEAIAAAHGRNRAADYVVEAWHAGSAGLEGLDLRLIDCGLELAGDRRDLNWAYLYVLSTSNHDVELAELVQDERFGLACRSIMAHTGNAGIGIVLSHTHPTRDDQLTLGDWPSARLFGAGDLRTTVAQFHEAATELKRVGRLLSWAKQLLYEAIAETSMGDLDRAEALLDELARTELPYTASHEVRDRLLLAAYLLWSARDDGWELVERFTFDGYVDDEPDENVTLHCSRAKFHARRGRAEAAAASLDAAVPLLPTHPDAVGFLDRLVVHDVVEAVWLAGIERHVELFGRLVDERLARDLRGPMSDMRLCKARLAALRGDVAEAGRWFAASRGVLDEAGARPLRAIVDFDEALMYDRLGDQGDSGRRDELLDTAIRQFSEIGMTGWQRRANALAAAADPRG